MKPIVSANKKFLCDLEQDIRDYEHSNPECTLQDLIDNFGEPELIAKQQIELMSEEDFLRISKKRKRYFVAVIILCIVCIAPVSYTHLDVYKRQVHDYNGIFSVQGTCGFISQDQPALFQY